MTESLQQQKMLIQDELDKISQESKTFDISNTNKFIEGHSPYILVAVTLSESEYFYLHKASSSWIYVYVQDDMTFTQDFADFGSVNHLLHDRLRTSLTDFNVIYCKKSIFYESVNNNSEDVETPMVVSSDKDEKSEDDKLLDI